MVGIHKMKKIVDSKSSIYSLTYLSLLPALHLSFNQKTSKPQKYRDLGSTILFSNYMHFDIRKRITGYWEGMVKFLLPSSLLSHSHAFQDRIIRSLPIEYFISEQVNNCNRMYPEGKLVLPFVTLSTKIQPTIIVPKFTSPQI